MRRGLLPIICGVLLLSGCATGRTEFKVIKITPQPLATATPTPGDQPETPGHTVAAGIYVVVRGDCLWNICARHLGDPWKYREIARTNDIPDPDLIEPGQRLDLGVRLDRADTGARGTSTPARTLTRTSAHTPSPTPTPTFPERPNRAFGPGEKLLFSVEYFGISAGYATLSVHAGPEMFGRPTLHLIATARTHPAFEWIFKVRDRIESFFDARGLFSWRYEKHLREGGYSNDSFIIYDQHQQKVIKDNGRTVLPASPLVQDVLSEFYYFRTLPAAVGDEITFPVFADDGKEYEIVVKVLRREQVSVPAGKFNCLVVQPLLKFEGIFQSKGKMHIWITDDQRKVPVLIKSAIIIGTIDIVLRDAVVVDVE